MNGFYGMRNFGDDLFRTILSELLPSLWPSEEFRFTAPKGNLRLGHPLTPMGPIANLYTRADTLGSAARGLTHIDATLRARRAVMGGGSLMQRPSLGLRLQLRYGKYEEWRALGVSVGPVETERDHSAVLRFLEQCSFLAVRDSASLEITEQIYPQARPVLTGDLAAFYRPPIESDVSQHPNGTIYGYAPCSTSTFSPEDQFATLMSIIGDSSEGPLTVRILSLSNHPLWGDDEICRNAVERLRSKGIVTEYYRYSDIGVDAMWSLIAHCTSVVATRLHAAIPAFLSGVPFVLHEYHPKCTHFLDDVGQANQARLLPQSRHRALEVTPALPALAADEYRSRAHAALNDIMRGSVNR